MRSREGMKWKEGMRGREGLRGRDSARWRDGFVPYMSNLFASGYNSKVEDVSIFCTVYRIYSQI